MSSPTWAAPFSLLVRPLHLPADELASLATPAVLECEPGRYVILEQLTARSAHILELSGGRRRVSRSELSARYSGVAAEVSPSAEFARRPERPRMSLLSFFRWSPDVRSSLGQVFLLSLFLQIYVLASPFYMRLVVDETITRGDTDFLGALAIGFGLFAVFNAGAAALRGIAIQRLAAVVSWDITTRTYSKLIRLPLLWFQSQKLADILSRLQSLEPIRNLVAGGLVTVLIDGILSLLTVTLMLIISPPLCAVAVGAFLFYLIVRCVALPISFRLSANSLRALIAEQTKRIEVIRAMQTIKIMAAETERENDLVNRLAENIQDGQRNAYNALAFGTANQFALSISVVIITYLGARYVIAGELTLGMLFAFAAYQAQFFARSTSLVEQTVSWRLLGIHTSRMADILLAAPERNIDKPVRTDALIHGQLRLENVTFQYSLMEPPVLKAVNLVVDAGEFIAITGASGGGKTTLLKVMCGLFAPVRGEVLLDGMAIGQWGPRTVRRSMGIVMQDDELLTGTVADNIAFFSPEPDQEWLWECLRAVGMEREIRALPLQLDTPIGDLGHSLSGGQRQRVFLARALYRRPKLLLLDEATAHLDPSLVKIVNTTLSKLPITRIVIAHNAETIAAANRVVVLEDGVLKDVARPAREEGFI